MRRYTAHGRLMEDTEPDMECFFVHYSDAQDAIGRLQKKLLEDMATIQSQGDEIERLNNKCAALAKLAYPANLLRLRAGLLAHACYCGSSDLDPAVHREDCAYRKWASPEQESKP